MSDHQKDQKKPCGVCLLTDFQKTRVPKLAKKLANKDHPDRPKACHKYMKQNLHMHAPSLDDVNYHLKGHEL